MRLVAALIFLLTLAAAAMAGQVLWHEINAPAPDVTPARTAASGSAEAPVAIGSGARRWPALFGEPQPPAPAAPVRSEPAAPSAPLPPLESLGFQLKGVVRSGTQVWAMIGHPSGDQLVRVGDELGRGIEVTDINEDGLWLRRAGNPPEVLSFPR